MTGVIATLPKYQFSNALGIPMSGGTLTSYLAGTTTPTNTYQDEALSTANTNPISLDSRGECLLWLDSTKNYKFVLKNALGVTQWTVDDITGAGALADRLRTDLAADDGTSLVGDTAPWTGAVKRTVQEKFRDVICVLDGMTTAQIQDVRAGVVFDSSAIVQAAFDHVTLSGSSGKGMKVWQPYGKYYLGTGIQIPNATTWYGDGRQQTIIRPMPGFAGVLVTDKGNGSKIFIRHMRIDALNEAGVTGLIKLGYGGAAPFAQAELCDLFLAGGVPGVSTLAGCIALDLTTNVASLSEIEAGQCGTTFKLGSGSTVTTFDRCFSISATAYDFLLNGSVNLTNCEIEAPGASCVGVYVSRETVINGLTYSQGSGITNPFAIEIDSACPAFSMSGFTHFTNGASVLTNVIKDNRTANPTNWVSNETGSAKNASLAVDDLYLSTNNLNIRGKQLQQFTLRITNTGGTIQHRISVQGSAGKLHGKINAASATLQNTPTGADASTAFAYGGKLSTTAPSVFIFDTAAQVIDEQVGIGTLVYNSTTTALLASFFVASYDVNGVTKNRLVVQFMNPTTGAAYTISGMGVGTIIDATFMGFLV